LPALLLELLLVAGGQQEKDGEKAEVHAGVLSNGRWMVG